MRGTGREVLAYDQGYRVGQILRTGRREWWHPWLERFTNSHSVLCVVSEVHRYAVSTEPMSKWKQALVLFAGQVLKLKRFQPFEPAPVKRGAYSYSDGAVVTPVSAKQRQDEARARFIASATGPEWGDA